MRNENERAEFEKVVREDHGHLNLLVRDDGKYVNLYTQSMFDLWCHARSRSSAVPAVTDAMVEVALMAANKYALQDERHFKSAEDCMRAALVAAFGAAAPEPQQAVPLNYIQHSNRLAAEHAQEQLLTRREWEALAAAAVASPRHGGEPVAYVPVHPVTGPLWADVYSAAAGHESRALSYERMPLYAAPVSAPAQAPVVTDDMVHRFLAWKLPETFSPDGGVRIDERWQKRFGWPPSGTNLLNKDEARAMLEHVLATSAVAVGSPADARNGECTSCNGSGETVALVGGGPDAYETPVNCIKCAGTGAQGGAQ